MLFFSTFLYAFARRHGARWHDEARRQIALGQDSELEALRTLSSLSLLREEIHTAIMAPMRLAVGRSMNAGQFQRSPADVWVSCDDDAQADGAVLSRLVEAARSTRGIVSAPCLQRGDPGKPPTKDAPGLLNVRFALGQDTAEAVETYERFALAPIYSTGFGLVAVHRDAIDGMCGRFPELEVEDEDSGQCFPALFFERLTGEAPHRRWQGEDMAFCARARDVGVQLHALLGADVTHAGRRLRLEQDGDALAMRVFDV